MMQSKKYIDQTSEDKVISRIIRHEQYNHDYVIDNTINKLNGDRC